MNGSSGSAAMLRVSCTSGRSSSRACCTICVRSVGSSPRCLPRSARSALRRLAATAPSPTDG
eukprot:7065331-Prymnesium_polylepis.1